ncbi:hypothetical protein CDL12_03459 [Handroanthus impetiginosus]|uniref:Uncharacterized protein n=1 Tax=Handroanthus impetiginosus TaxID=429701 RepID=A0A2G9I219_9LAMI|nr:hypothetical protein CDL12_03459 [Handroanthus impetiginosus]
MLKFIIQRICRRIALFLVPRLLGYLQLIKMRIHQISSRASAQNVACDTGVQTDKTSEESTSPLHNVCRGSEKLFGLWNSDDRKLGRVLVSKLFITCEADFHVLFGYLNSPQSDPNMALSLPTQPIEAAKVSHLYSVLAKISNDTSRLEELLEALVDLCSLKNVVIVHRSLRVVHKILCISFSMGKKFGKRENVIIEEPLSGNTMSDINGWGNPEGESLYFTSIAEMLKQGQVPFAVKFSNVKTPRHTGLLDHSFGASISGVYWISFFGHMCQIAIKNNEEQIRHEALSIMNLILMRHNTYLERDKFVGELVFQSLSQLLRREAGFSVQDQAVHTLHLLCNCPKVIAMLCSGFNEEREHACSQDINDKSISAFQWLNEILIGLADCVAFYGSATAEEMKLRRNAVVFLAFLASSGKSGFDILLNHRLPKGTNFLAIILRGLISDLDLQASKSAKKSGIIKEQILLTREALILLNRLVSHPQYSIPVLQTLTNTRDMASTTVDVANRLTQRSKLLWPDNNTTKQIRESEIMDLAWVFKKRVFTYLGDSIS